MKVHLTWIGVAALTAAAFNVDSARAQYAPYVPQQQSLPQAAGYPAYSGYPATTQGVAMPGAAVTAPAATQATASRYSIPAAPAVASTPYVATAPRYSQTTSQPAAQVPAYSYPQTTYPQTTYPQTAQAPSYPSVSNFTTYSSVAQQPAPPVPPTPPAPTNGEQIPAPKSATTDSSAASPEASLPAGAAPAVGNGHGYNGTGYPTANAYSGLGQLNSGTTDYGIDGACEPQGGGHIWFGGLYYLFMERDNPTTQKLTVRVDHDAATDPYYPPANVTVLDTDKTDFDFRSGVELRFGSTFSIGSDCDEGCGGHGYPSTCSSCAQDNFAWEVAWWGLDEDDQASTYYDRNPLNNVRLYGMVNFAGIDYDGRPVNDFYGYGLPIVAPTVPPMDGDIIVMGQRTRSYFSAQNIEINLIRFAACDSGCGGGTNCGYDSCGYGAYGCEPVSNPISFSMCGMCGVRYFRIDDDFYYGSQWAEWGGGTYGTLNWLNYDINVDNSLIGPQVGWNMNYCVASKWNFFCNTSFGVFNNHIESNQRVWGENGTARHIQSGDLMSSETDKDDVSFLGELRLGGSYDVTCNWRAVLAYRAVAITGVANSVDQIPTDFTNAQYPGMIDSDSSIVVHGLQAGVECKY